MGGGRGALSGSGAVRPGRSGSAPRAPLVGGWGRVVGGLVVNCIVDASIIAMMSVRGAGRFGGSVPSGRCRRCFFVGFAGRPVPLLFLGGASLCAPVVRSPVRPAPLVGGAVVAGAGPGAVCWLLCVCCGSLL